MIKDEGRISSLLGIVQAVAHVAPGFTAISAEAMAELRQINQAIEDERAKERGDIPPPAPVGDDDSPAPQMPSGLENSDQLDPHPVASKPIDRRV